MTAADFLRQSFAAVEVDAEFREAVLSLHDGSRLGFRHCVGERWARAVAPDGTADPTTLASQVLSLISLFRLNARHLDVQFADGSRWELPFGWGRGTASRTPRSWE